jgi:Fe-S oxidoreductase
MIMGLSMLEGRSALNDEVAEIIYKCQLCGACDASCKVYRDDIDITEVLSELRAECVNAGYLVIEHMAMIDALKKENNVLGEPKARRGEWAEGLGLKDVNVEKAEVLFHAGCRFSYDPDLRGAVRGIVRLLIEAGVDVGIAGAAEGCCGGRAYELGYRGEAKNFADDMQSRLRASGASTLVTACSDGYSTFRFAYPRMGVELDAEVLHITQYLERCVAGGRLRLKNEVPMLVTYHDPCHLGRMSEPYFGDWKGDKLLRPVPMKRAGKEGIYEPPRNLLGHIPGLKLIEMERIKEYSWCCGAGGGVLEAFEDFASWAARERLEEARATGAEALVTACPWCVRVFRDTANDLRMDFPVYELTELVARSAGLQPEEE